MHETIIHIVRMHVFAINLSSIVQPKPRRVDWFDLHTLTQNVDVHPENPNNKPWTNRRDQTRFVSNYYPCFVVDLLSTMRWWWAWADLPTPGPSRIIVHENRLLVRSHVPDCLLFCSWPTYLQSRTSTNSAPQQATNIDSWCGSTWAEPWTVSLFSPRPATVRTKDQTNKEMHKRNRKNRLDEFWRDWLCILNKT